MRKQPIFLAMLSLVGASMIASSCNGEKDTWEEYEDWREINTAFYNRQRDSLGSDGKLFYTTLTAAWNPAAEILIHYFNDRTETADNLQPMLNSTCDVIYIGRLYSDEAFDSSYTNTTYGDAIARFIPSSLITGFQMALLDMHVGDSVQILMPYTLGYGSSTTYSDIPPYSTLKFNIRLTDIPYYEIEK